ncbi:hypothetical protein [Actinoplanes auranticolor]|uniref:hypothetical protein n=1 Tax=Actinoplanes auranticolor TaxID=47988 RepID=UPI001BB3B6FB|nr:hypothetical protein [Actinoplanes auranticolor]
MTADDAKPALARGSHLRLAKPATASALESDAAGEPEPGPADGPEPGVADRSQPRAVSVSGCRPAEIAESAPPRSQADLPPGVTAAPGGSAGPGGSIAVPPGSIGVPIRLAEPTALGLIHPGDHVDVFRVPVAGESPQAIATAALVLDVTGADDPTSGGLLLALTPAEARRTVTAPGGGYAVLIRPDG